MASTLITPQIMNWRVSMRDFHSDHKCIQFTINLKSPPPPETRNLRKTDWAQFKNTLEDFIESMEIPETWNHNIIEETTN